MGPRSQCPASLNQLNRASPILSDIVTCLPSVDSDWVLLGSVTPVAAGGLRSTCFEYDPRLLDSSKSYAILYSFWAPYHVLYSINPRHLFILEFHRLYY